jgi:hypothetical protein
LPQRIRAARPTLADAVLLASAGEGDRIATANPHVLAVAEAEKLGSIALPSRDSAENDQHRCYICASK